VQPLPGGEGVELLLARCDELHRPTPGRLGEGVGERLEVDPGLPPEPAADVGDVDADVRMRDLKRVGEEVSHRVR